MSGSILIGQHIEQKVAAEVSVCVVGNPKVGKTAITRTFCQSIFSEDYIPTVGCEFETRLFEIDGKILKVHLHDISGQEAFLWISKKHIESADGLIFCYDITDPSTFESIPRWLTLMNSCVKHTNLPKLLLGNKLDMRHKQIVHAIKAKEFGIPNGMKQIEISAKSGQNLNAAFYILCNDILRFRQMGCYIPMGVKDDKYNIGVTHVHEIPSSIEGIVDGPDYTNVFRILLLGAVRTGKTALRLRYCRDHYSPEYYASAGLNYSTRTVMVDGEKVKLQIWDISGDDVYDTLRKGYYKGANGFIVVYDITNEDSFRKAEYLVKGLDMNGQSEIPKLVIGNKSDCSKTRRAVTGEETKEWADGWRVPVVEVSAKSGKNVDDAFHKLVIAVKKQFSPWKRVYDFS